mmetsp:Transcript_20393/g.50992  ORF Transcript_20393/g.50992 Transcript_20393/m.50992 type:complete len:252 (-) Transcript_20393:545-1300(-)
MPSVPATAVVDPEAIGVTSDGAGKNRSESLGESSLRTCVPSEASSNMSSIRNVEPCPGPAEERRKREPPCSRRRSRAIVRPRPVPPLPCICPRPTCVNASPRLSTRSSSAVNPEPESSTSSTTNAQGAAGLDELLLVAGPTWGLAAWAWASPRRARMLTVPPALVNLIELLTPLLTHCCSRRTSPMKTARSRSGGSGTRHNVTPLAVARPPKVSAAATSSCETRIAAGTRTNLPLSIRSKSNMSETMCCMS